MSIHRSPAGLALVTAAIALIGCESPTQPGADEPFNVDPVAGAVRDPGQPVLRFSDGEEVGASTLVRTWNGVNFHLTSEDLTPGDAYTLWIVIFNDPEECLAPTPLSMCSGPDVVNEDAKPEMMYAAGRIGGGSSKATFAGRRSAADMSGSINDPVGLPAFGLLDPFGAEIHLVVHHHGPKIPEFMPDMIQTVDGGCTDAGIPAPGAPSPWNDHEGFGARGPNACQSIQFAVHQP